MARRTMMSNPLLAQLNDAARADPDIVACVARAVGRAEFVIEIGKLGNKRCPTLHDLVTGALYMFEPQTPGYGQLMCMLDRCWPNSAKYSKVE